MCVCVCVCVSGCGMPSWQDDCGATYTRACPCDGRCAWCWHTGTSLPRTQCRLGSSRAGPVPSAAQARRGARILGPEHAGRPRKPTHHVGPMTHGGAEATCRRRPTDNCASVVRVVRVRPAGGVRVRTRIRTRIRAARGRGLRDRFTANGRDLIPIFVGDVFGAGGWCSGVDRGLRDDYGDRFTANGRYLGPIFVGDVFGAGGWPSGGGDGGGGLGAHG